jgi:hypothetical protein
LLTATVGATATHAAVVCAVVNAGKVKNRLQEISKDEMTALKATYGLKNDDDVFHF